jgi:hypothetical protein
MGLCVRNLCSLQNPQSQKRWRETLVSFSCPKTPSFSAMSAAYLVPEYTVRLFMSLCNYKTPPVSLPPDPLLQLSLYTKDTRTMCMVCLRSKISIPLAHWERFTFSKIPNDSGDELCCSCCSLPNRYILPGHAFRFSGLVFTPKHLETA